MIRINNIKIRKNISNEEVFLFAIKKYKINSEDVLDWKISKKSIDARKKEDVHYNYSIDLNVKNEKKYPRLHLVKEFHMPKISTCHLESKHPVIIGART